MGIAAWGSQSLCWTDIASTLANYHEYAPLCPFLCTSQPSPFLPTLQILSTIDGTASFRETAGSP